MTVVRHKWTLEDNDYMQGDGQMEDVLFYQNYTSATDISAIAVCVVCWLLLGSTYTIKQKNLVTFNIGNAFFATRNILAGG